MSQQPKQRAEESREPTLDEVVADSLRRIATAMEKANRVSFGSELVSGERRLTLTCKRYKPKVCEACGDLPPKVATMSKATRRVYLTLRDARSKDDGAAAEIWQTDIFEAIRQATPRDELSIRTVHRVLKALCACNAVRKDDRLGYFIGGQQLSLPFFECQPDGVSPDWKRE